MSSTMAMATGSLGVCIALSVIAFMAAWTCVRLRDDRSGMGPSSSSRLFKTPIALSDRRDSRAVVEACKPLVRRSPQTRHESMKEAFCADSRRHPLYTNLRGHHTRQASGVGYAKTPGNPISQSSQIDRPNGCTSQNECESCGGAGTTLKQRFQHCSSVGFPCLRRALFTPLSLGGPKPLASVCR